MKHLLAFCIITFLCAAPVWAAPPDTAQLNTQGLAVIQQFSAALKGELKASLKRGGPPAAIMVCRVQAPAIAKRVGEKNGWQVGRTSGRLRNPANAPDPWEAKVLADFAARAQAGAAPGKLVYSEVLTDAQGKRVFRLMKGIAMGGGCLVCHGPSPSKATSEQLALLYPKDKATGYRPGQLRGAFTLKKVLD
ncbi:MAG: DUF3365 domain-containing protein [Desulfarculus sp.]|nr:DUF3365 domain-containing protein [Pseudomonadota bacterium]MBV1715297.1 DUF3365 domain-containing protein [Desulfarculus sp.]MBU4573960.1 DUF3365 domain-containing protein [Pseudomonadota bacterium]MBU4596643.1 DUF3365 domain-containing protein [Pseudomonadota bacterium]MBV1737951.1 DUF3365 domain-containing protein [Desulfarculus sp.]